MAKSMQKSDKKIASLSGLTGTKAIALQKMSIAMSRTPSAYIAFVDNMHDKMLLNDSEYWDALAMTTYS